MEFVSILMGITLLLVQSECLRVPENPCPNIFQYRYDGRVYYGEIKVPYDGSGLLDLAVNASFIGYHKTKLNLSLVTPKERLLYPGIVMYKVEFPFRDILPKITQIVFNSAVYCFGLPEQPTFQNAVTNIWSSATYLIERYTVQAGVPINIPGVNVAPVSPNNGIMPNNPNPLQVGAPSGIGMTNNVAETNETPVNPNNGNSVPNNRPIHNFSMRPNTIPTNVFDNRFELNKEKECGIANEGQNLVVGGTNTKPNEFPWMVAIYKAMGETYRYYCTGILITKRHVLTAANCIKFFNAIILPKEDALLVMGRSDLSRWATNGATLRTVEEIFIHPNYKQYTGHGDIAVMKLKRPVEFTKDIRAICLWDGNDSLSPYVNKLGIVAGWGKDTEGKNDNIPEAKKIQMPIVSQETCLRSNGGSYIEITSNMTFCAGDRSGRGPCVGDSGSGFMLKINQKYYLRGLVSVAIHDPNGDIACDLKQYVVFSDIAKTQNWIRDIISQE